MLVSSYANNKVLADDAATHVTLDHEGETAKHSPFRGHALPCEDAADSLSQCFIEGHHFPLWRPSLSVLYGGPDS